VSLGLRVAETSTTDGDYDVLFTSWRRDIDYINAGADVAVLTSNNEGTPVSIIEAMAGGKAVITTNVGGVQDFIENEVNGVVSSSDLQDFSNNLVKLIADSEFRRTLGENAVSTAFRLFSYDRLLSDMRSYYNQLLNQKK
jgi:glycosyltransferase involved in cell wall biosynthesis